MQFKKTKELLCILLAKRLIDFHYLVMIIKIEGTFYPELFLKNPSLIDDN
jgi:hypothetical protein